MKIMIVTYILLLFLIQRFNFLTSFRVRENWAENTVSIYYTPIIQHSFSPLNILHQYGMFVTINVPVFYTLLLTKFHNLHEGSLCVLVSIGFDKCIMSWIYHYSIWWYSFTALNILCFICSIFPLDTLASTDIFIFCKFFPLQNFVM